MDFFPFSSSFPSSLVINISELPVVVTAAAAAAAADVVAIGKTNLRRLIGSDVTRVFFYSSIVQ